MERYYQEPVEERLQWVALAIVDDWGGEWLRAALTALLKMHGLDTGEREDATEDMRVALTQMTGLPHGNSHPGIQGNR